MDIPEEKHQILCALYQELIAFLEDIELADIIHERTPDKANAVDVSVHDL
jgi:hypothetical protein